MPPAGLRGAFCMLRGARHVALEESHVAMGVQRDVAEAGSLVFARKRSKNREPRHIGGERCRIGGERCRVGGPTRRGWSRKPDFYAEKGPKA